MSVAAAEALARRLHRRCSRDRLLREVGSAARDAGAGVWLVGGAVRDAALGRPARDVDLIAVRRSSVLVAELQAAWSTRGFRFRKRGVTTVRFAVAGRQVDIVDAARRGLRRDLERRETTINAMAFDLVERSLVDPLGGLADLRRRLLRMPRPGAIRDDPLRALRAARFLAELPEFELHRELRAAARRAAGPLGKVAVERVRDELDALLRAAAPQRGLRELERLALLDAVLPELAPLRDCVAGAARPDVWSHTVACLEISATRGRLPAAGVRRDPAALGCLRWALLLHDISKPDTLDRHADGRPTFHGHETLGARRADTLLRRLRVPRELRAAVVRVIRLHLRPSLLAEAGAPERGLRRLVRDAGAELPVLVHHAACDALGSGGPDDIRRWRRLRRVLLELLELHARYRQTPRAPLLSGRDVLAELGCAPGPRVGRLLAALEEARDEGRVGNRQEALALLRRLDRGLRRDA